MTGKRAFVPNRLRPWVDAQRKWKLSDLHVQMARELGLNPNKLGKIANHRQQSWKAPLPDFITRCYVKRFGKVPDVVRTIEEVAAAEMAKRQARKMRKHGSPPGFSAD
ncbi:MAG: hypothetical protein GEV13_21560 [Rhodospirillales bacterium]|nr:hypothetical protein [Rhodospirillales bacterium]